jgi:hypothetical protein
MRYGELRHRQPQADAKALSPPGRALLRCVAFHDPGAHMIDRRRAIRRFDWKAIQAALPK